jgi:hypothetical protein
MTSLANASLICRWVVAAPNQNYYFSHVGGPGHSQLNYVYAFVGNVPFTPRFTRITQVTACLCQTRTATKCTRRNNS